MTTTQPRRDEKIRLFMMGDNQFEGRNMQDDVVLDNNDNFFIYMKNVNFRKGNIIEGRYLGNLTDKSAILDDKCKIVATDGDKFYIDTDNQIRSARMVAVNNKTKVIVIIQK